MVKQLLIMVLFKSPKFFFESIALLFFLFLTILNLKFANNSDKIFVDLSVLFLITIKTAT